jgi:hypothetical protein
LNRYAGWGRANKRVGVKVGVRVWVWAVGARVRVWAALTSAAVVPRSNSSRLKPKTSSSGRPAAPPFRCLLSVRVGAGARVSVGFEFGLGFSEG